MPAMTALFLCGVVVKLCKKRSEKSPMSISRAARKDVGLYGIVTQQMFCLGRTYLWAHRLAAWSAKISRNRFSSSRGFISTNWHP